MKPEGSRGYNGPSLDFTYDKDRDVITIEGQEYSGEIFRQFGQRGLATGSLFSFERTGNSIAIRVVWDAERS